MATILENVQTLSVHLEDAYTALEGKGATIPQQKNATNLSATVDSLPAAGFTIDDLLGSTAKDLVINVTEIKAGNASTYSGGAYNLFRGRDTVKTVGFPNLVKVNSQGCANMFNGCTNLTELKSLPATNIAANCYQAMFYGCTSLASVPAVLPATTIAAYCYSNMFYGCSSLRTAPALPATTLAVTSYISMFQNCTSLTSAPALPATTLTTGCYSNMFYGCSSLTTAPSLSATTFATNCYQNMFQGCRALTAVPDMPEQIDPLQGVCNNMFRDCTALTGSPVVKVKPAATIANLAFQTMFQNCPNLTKVTLDFTLFSSVPQLYNYGAVNIFNNPLDTRFEIRVPAALEESWKTATNWSDWATFIVGV